MVASPDPLAVDVGTTGGDWLFKQGDLLLGPVPARVLVEKLYGGEIDGATPIAQQGEERFLPLEQVEVFKIHAKKAKVKLELERASHATRAAEQRRRNAKLGIFLGLGAAVLVAGALGANYLAVHKPWRASSVGELEIPITVEAPSIAVAAADADEIALPLAPSGTGAATSAAGAHRAKRASHPAGAAPTPGTSPQGTAEPDGLQTAQFDTTAINDVVNGHTRTLYPCLKAEAMAHPGMSADIPLEFTVGNDGKVDKLWVDNPAYKQGPLYECMLKVLRGWPFRPYQGERANVKLSFHVGARH